MRLSCIFFFPCPSQVDVVLVVVDVNYNLLLHLIRSSSSLSSSSLYFFILLLLRRLRLLFILSDALLLLLSPDSSCSSPLSFLCLFCIMDKVVILSSSLLEALATPSFGNSSDSFRLKSFLPQKLLCVLGHAHVNWDLR